MSVASEGEKKRPGRALRIAFEQFDTSSGWTGGSVYMQNLLAALQSLDDADRPFVLLTRTAGEAAYSAMADKKVEIPVPPPARFFVRGIRKVAQRTGFSALAAPTIAPFLADEKIDVIFTFKRYPQPLKPAVIGWIPDFQYLHLPEMTSAGTVEFLSRHHRYVVERSAAVMVSSNDVLKDLVRFAPEAAGRVHVVRFVAQIPANVYDRDPSYIAQKYSLPERYYFLPNQFWKHKNHLLVIEALRLLKEKGSDITVVCTGNTYDDRNPGFFASLLGEVAKAGVHQQFRILGLVAREDVFPLQRQAMAILQPSLFEGWSTSIEEAKSLGKRVIASDLPVHREQIPDADFFARRDAESLASQLHAVAQQALPGPDLQREALAREKYPGRVRQFATEFMAVAADAWAKKGR